VGGHTVISFWLGDYDPALPLIIDPALSFSSFLGGSGSDWGNGMDVDAAGNIYLTGVTNSTDFPLYHPLTTTKAGSTDVFITKLVKTGSVYTYSFSTYLGGSSGEEGFDIAVGENGRFTSPETLFRMTFHYARPLTIRSKTTKPSSPSSSPRPAPTPLVSLPSWAVAGMSMAMALTSTRLEPSI